MEAVKTFKVKQTLEIEFSICEDFGLWRAVCRCPGHDLLLGPFDSYAQANIAMQSRLLQEWSGKGTP